MKVVLDKAALSQKGIDLKIHEVDKSTVAFEMRLKTAQIGEQAYILNEHVLEQFGVHPRDADFIADRMWDVYEQEVIQRIVFKQDDCI